MEEQRILREIEHGLHHDDRWFATRLVIRRMLIRVGRRRVLLLVAAELAAAAAAVAGALINQPALIVVGTGIAVAMLMVVLVVWSAMTDPPGTSGDAPPIMWYW